MQISNFMVCKYVVFKTPHIQIRFQGKDSIFKYEFLVLFSHPCVLLLLHLLLNIFKHILRHNFHQIFLLPTPVPFCPPHMYTTTSSYSATIPEFCLAATMAQLMTLITSLACLCRISPEVSVVREALLPREQPSHILQVQWPLPAPDTSQV